MNRVADSKGNGSYKSIEQLIVSVLLHICVCVCVGLKWI